MKLIFTSGELAAVSHLKDVLDSAGIACVIKNEMPAYLAGDSAMFAPELWIDDDSRLAEALEIKKDYLGSQSAFGASWTCLKCGEKIEAQFDSCWKCGTPRPPL